MADIENKRAQNKLSDTSLAEILEEEASVSEKNSTKWHETLT